MKRALLFDLDGTIVKSEGIHHEIEHAIFHKHDVHPVEGDWADTTGRTSLAIFRRFIDKYNIPATPEQLVQEKTDMFCKVAPSKLQMFAGFHELLRRADGWRRALVTSSEAGIALATLDLFKIRDLFETLVTGDIVKKGKPDPEPYALAAQRLGIEPRRCVALEDALNGIKSAKAAGCRTIAITNSFSAKELKLAGADEVVGSFDEITCAMLAGLVP